MHQTRSVEYAVIMAGEIDMLTDDEDVHLSQCMPPAWKTITIHTAEAARLICGKIT